MTGSVGARSACKGGAAPTKPRLARGQLNEFLDRQATAHGSRRISIGWKAGLRFRDQRRRRRHQFLDRRSSKTVGFFGHDFTRLLDIG